MIEVKIRLFSFQQNKNKFLESLTGVPNKSLYLFQDVERVAAYYQVTRRK